MATLKHIALHGESISLVTVSCNHILGCGCKGISNCCSDCPLIDCRFIKKGGVKAIRAMSRNQEIVRMRSLGKTVSEISDRFGLHQVTISRILRKKEGGD